MAVLTWWDIASMAEADGFNLMTTCLSSSRILCAQCALVSTGRMSISAGTKDTAVLTQFWLAGTWHLADSGGMCVLTPTVLVGSDRYDKHGEPSPITYRCIARFIYPTQHSSSLSGVLIFRLWSQKWNDLAYPVYLSLIYVEGRGLGCISINSINLRL